MKVIIIFHKLLFVSMELISCDLLKKFAFYILSSVIISDFFHSSNLSSHAVPPAFLQSL